MKRFTSICTHLIILLYTVLIHAQPVNSNTASSPPTIQEMTRQISRLRAEGKTAQEIYQYQQAIFQPSASGSISGTIFQSDGASPLTTDANITAYDSYGYYINSGYISSGNTIYSIINLPPGLYYVQVYPYGNYISEFYNNATDWRQATLVRVGIDSQTVDINFELADGKVISGKILEEISLDPLVGIGTQFMLYQADAKLETEVYRYYYTNPNPSGTYFIQGLAPGDYKLKVWTDRLEQEFYQNKTQLSEADVLSISAETDTLKFINFLLGPVLAVQDGYEPNNTYLNAYQMTIGDSVTPQINPAGDVDYFSFNGLAGDSVISFLKAKSIGSSMLPYLVIYDSSGTNFLGGWAGPDIKITNVQLPYSGRYICQITQNGPPAGGEDFYYTFMIDEAPTLKTGSISGNVYLDNRQTPYNGQGYYIYLYDSETLNSITSIYTQSPHYQFDNIPVGQYKINIDTYPDPIYLGEWFDDARLVDQADVLSVTASDTLKDVDFILDRGGSISGRIFLDNLSTDFTTGGNLYFYTGETFGLINSYYVPPNDEGLYLVSRLQPGQYQVGFSPDYLLADEYPTVWYDQVGIPFQGTPVDITVNDTTENINFILLKGGRIQGFVRQPDGMTPLGSDSMQVDLVIYDPLSGNMINEVIENTFSAGYRTPLLFPGSYKFQALSQVSSLASWYYEDGHNFEDINTTDIEIQSGTVQEVNITLITGAASISGIVYEQDGSTPTERPGRVYAYDASGHIVQSTVIGVDPATNQLLETGHYRLTGLKNGSYYLMLTFDFIDMQQIINKSKISKSAGTDRSNPEISARIGPRMLTMKQIWYGEVVVDLENVRYLHFQNIPESAVAVAVTEPNDTPNIDFSYLRSAIDLTYAEAIPSEFNLASVYPNPFNPGTTIRYGVPFASQVTIEIFDILGRKVATVLDQKQSSGWHTVQWNGRTDQQQAVTSGIYIARLKAADKISTRKMILLR